MGKPPENPYWVRMKPHSTPKYTLGVKDGDTIAARLDLGFGHDPLFNVRLYGVDTPEKYGTRKCRACRKVHTQDQESDEEIAAAKAKAFVIRMMKMAQPHPHYKEGVAAMSIERAKYAGRAVCDVQIHIGEGEWVRLADAIVDAGLGYEYGTPDAGLTKQCFNEWYQS